VSKTSASHRRKESREAQDVDEDIIIADEKHINFDRSPEAS
jgi:hypothetical protein